MKPARLRVVGKEATLKIKVIKDGAWYEATTETPDGKEFLAAGFTRKDTLADLTRMIEEHGYKEVR